jgi:hypothetical protein
MALHDGGCPDKGSVPKSREHEIATGASYCAVALNGMQAKKLLPLLCAESL